MSVRPLNLATMFLASLTTATAVATPTVVEYSIEANPQVTGDLFFQGARLTVQLRLDTASLMPTSGVPNPDGSRRTTYWPTLNTSGTVSITGNPGINGIYPISETLGGWMLRSTDSTAIIAPPSVLFMLGSEPVGISKMEIRLPAT